MSNKGIRDTNDNIIIHTEDLSLSNISRKKIIHVLGMFCILALLSFLTSCTPAEREELPLAETWRHAVFGGSMVLKLTNTSKDRTLYNLIAQFDGGGESGPVISSRLEPGETVEIGHFELSRGPKYGDTILVQDSRHIQMKFKVPNL